MFVLIKMLKTLDLVTSGGRVETVDLPEMDSELVIVRAINANGKLYAKVINV